MTTPAFRTDLVATPVMAEGEQYVDVVDPASGSKFRFFEVEYALASAMNGQRDTLALTRWALEELGLDVEPVELETLMGTLSDLGFLANNAPTPADNVATGGLFVASSSADALEEGDDFDAQPTQVADNPEAQAILTGRLGAAGNFSAGAASPVTPLDAGPPPVDDTVQMDEPLQIEQLDQGPADYAAGPGAIDFATDQQDAMGGLDIETGEVPTYPIDDAPLQLESDAPIAPDLTLQSDRPYSDAEPTIDLEGPPDPVAPTLPADEPISTEYRMDKPIVDEVSVDLGAHVPVAKHDVQEAVRQSRSMQAVAPPPSAPPVSGTAATMLGMESPVTPPQQPPRSKRVSSVPPPLPASGKRASTATPAPPVKSAQPTERIDRTAHRLEEEPRSSKTLGVLMAILALAVLGAGGFFLYQRYYQSDDAAGAKKPAKKTPLQKPGKQTTPPAQTVELKGIAKRAANEPLAIKSEKRGAVAFKAANNAAVSEGDVLAIAGDCSGEDKKVAQYVDKIENDYGARMVTFKEKLAEYTKEDNKSGISRYEKKIETLEKKIAGKQELLDAAKADAAKCTVKSPIAGEFVRAVEEGESVSAGKRIGDIRIPQKVNVELDAAELKKMPSAGDKVTVMPVVKAEGLEDSYDCSVVTAGDGKIALECDSKLPDRTQVKAAVPQ